MADIFDLYKPLRNAIRKLALQPSLKNCWNYQKRADVSGTIRIPVSFGGRNPFEFHVWELHILCREILLHANGYSDALSSLNGLANYINLIRDLTSKISRRTINSGDSALQALFPLAHQQVRWQYSLDEARIFRTFYIYSDPDLATIFKRVTGTSISDMCAMSLTISGIAKSNLSINTNQDYSVIVTNNEARDTFFKMTTKTINDIRKIVSEKQRYDESWAYTWNPLEAWPLINIEVAGNSEIWCPLPELLFRRVTEGVFYDLVDSGEKKFGDKFGRSFERYVGKVLGEIFNSEKYKVCGEQPYNVSGQTKHGVDWIVSDDSGNIFIECKARRLLHEAKESSDGDALKRSLENLANAVVQLYRNINDVISGKSKWCHNDLPIYPFVITYEDWYLFTPHIINYLLACVRRKLQEHDMSPSVIDENPFFVTSIAEVERAGQAISHFGIERFCTCAEVNQYRYFKLSGLALAAFPGENIIYRRLFQDGWSEMLPHLKHLINN